MRMNSEITENTPSGNDEMPNLPPQAESFAELFEKSSKQTIRYAPGQKIKAKIVSISGDLAFIDLGDKSEGAVNLSEFKDKDGTIQIKAGDEFDAFYVSVENGIRKFTTLIRGYSAVSLKNIQDAFEAGRALPEDEAIAFALRNPEGDGKP